MPVVRDRVYTARIETEKALTHYRGLGHKISNGGWHDLHDCPTCYQAGAMKRWQKYVNR
jgi:hypothetical protein